MINTMLEVALSYVDDIGLETTIGKALFMALSFVFGVPLFIVGMFLGAIDQIAKIIIQTLDKEKP